ncbi:MAG: hypothetical protein IPK16_21865 [Anaerolineales bacterium]|nr:hypothetical protein [Anaerolineales bacterium]
MPHNPEGMFWFACTLVNAGQLAAALPYFGKVFAAQPVWCELVPRLAQAGLLPGEPTVLAAIVKA